MVNKEYGSDFYYVTDKNYLVDKNYQIVFNESQFSLFFSGRAALYHLLAEGIHTMAWKKVFIPSFYCHEVVNFIRSLPIEIEYYDFNPFLDSEDTKYHFPDLRSTVVVNVLYFGLKKLNLSNYKNAVLIEDITHNILQFKNSVADYCFGSLRKELPLPVGGFCYSPKDQKLPIASSNVDSEHVSIQKLTAMFIKNLYLTGECENKNDFRKLFISAESKFEHKLNNVRLPQSSKSILFQLDVNKIINSKQRNIALALAHLLPNDKLKFNLNYSTNTALGLIIECENEKIQSELKNVLLKENIYPAVLWPNQLSERDREVEKRILFVHLDFRYTLEDINFIVNIIKTYIDNE